MVVTKTGEKIIIKGRCRRRTGETKYEGNKKMEKTKKKVGRRNTFETGERRRKNIYIYSGLRFYLVMVLVDQIMGHQRAGLLVHN